MVKKRFSTFYIANKRFSTTKTLVSKTTKIDREKLFADVLDKKEAFKDYKNNGLRKTQY